MSVAYETSFTMRGATTVTLQCHQILHLPRNINLMIDPRHIWNVIYNARSNTGYCPTSPNTAPATKFWVQDVSGKSLNCFRQYKDDPSMIRAWSEDKIVISHPPLRRPYSSHLGDAFCMEKYNIWRSGYLSKFHEVLPLPRKWRSNFTKYCTCHAKWISWLIRVTYDTSFTMRGATTVTLQCHQILHLPRNINLMIDPRHIWNVIYNARSNTGYCPTSPNTAPATKFWVQDVSGKSLNCFRQYKDDPSMIRAWSEHDPKIKSSSRTRRFGDLTRPILETILYWKIQHFALRLSPKMSPNAAPATKSDNPTSPNTAPATQNESHDWCASHMKRHFQCAEQAMSTSNLSKYCACHEIFKFKIAAETLWIASANIKTIRG